MVVRNKLHAEPELIRVLSFFARGKEIGFAIIADGELIRYGVKTVSGRRCGATFKRKVEKSLLIFARACRRCDHCFRASP